MFKVRLTNKAEKALKRIDQNQRNKLKKAIDSFTISFRPLQYDIKKIKGRKGMFRLRLGDVRINYLVDFKTRRIVVITIEKRGKAYQKI